MPEIGLFEAIYSARSLRRLKPDPVPEELITKVLEAAIRAPSGCRPKVTPERDAGKRGRRGEQRGDTDEDAYVHSITAPLCSCYVHTINTRPGKTKTARS